MCAFTAGSFSVAFLKQEIHQPGYAMHVTYLFLFSVAAVASNAIAGNYLSLEAFFTPFYYHDELLRIQAAQRRVQVCCATHT
jgi:hypothetical protein